MVLKLERYFHLSYQSFGFGSLIGLEYLLLVLSLRVEFKQERATCNKATWCPKRESRVKVIRSVTRHGHSASLGVSNDMIPHWLHMRLWSGT